MDKVITYPDYTPQTPDELREWVLEMLKTNHPDEAEHWDEIADMVLGFCKTERQVKAFLKGVTP